MILERLYDSHIHLVSTGELISGLNLSFLGSVQDLAKISKEEKYFRGSWFYGFGWDENKWPDRKLPTRFDLDQYFPDIPVFFVRADGHASWLNTKALEKLGYLQPQTASSKDGQILFDEHGVPTGILTESAHMKVYEQLPPRTQEQIQDFIIAACAEFNRNGFTHVRDMAGHQLQWQALIELEKQNKLSLYVEQNFACENLIDFERALSEALKAKQEETQMLKVKGIKFYFDGSLGSETAYLSKNYAHRKDQHRGFLCWELSDVEKLIRKTWENGLEVAVHTIGDAAAHQIVEIARKISSTGLGGRLNLEHVEVLRSETIQLMKPLHVTCHLQPCHWLTDRRWLKEKTGDLYRFAFPWAALEAAKVPFYFGSDSPIEKPSYFSNIEALEKSAQAGIPQIKQAIETYHCCPDLSTQARTTIENNQVKEVVFNGRKVFSS